MKAKGRHKRDGFSTNTLRQCIEQVRSAVNPEIAHIISVVVAFTITELLRGFIWFLRSRE